MFGDYIVYDMTTKKCSVVSNKDVQINELKQKCKDQETNLEILTEEIKILKWKLQK